MTTSVLVAVAGRHGATAGIAEEIAGVLRRQLSGATVEVRDAADPGDLGRFDAVLVGSAIYMGRWLPAARLLVETGRPAVRAVHSPTGDYRDHDAIRAWALEVAADLEGPPTSAATDPA